MKRVLIVANRKRVLIVANRKRVLIVANRCSVVALEIDATDDVVRCGALFY